MGKLSAGGGGRKNHFSIPLGLDRHCFPAGFVIYCNHIDYSTPRREVPYDMINLSQRMVALGTAKSEIREAFAFAQARAAAVGPEQVDDFSIGNPSVPAPDTVKELVHQLMDTVDPVKLHGYTPAQGEASGPPGPGGRPQPPVRHRLHGGPLLSHRRGGGGPLLRPVRPGLPRGSVPHLCALFPGV